MISVYENNIDYLFAAFVPELAKVFCHGPDRLHGTRYGFYCIFFLFCNNNNSLNMLCWGPQDHHLVQLLIELRKVFMLTVII